MTQQDHSPLGDMIATLRKAPAGPHRGMLPDALHALITAILTRIFARLEAIFLLWQADQLPAPTPRQRVITQAPNRKTSSPRPKSAGRRSEATSDSSCALSGTRRPPLREPTPSVEPPHTSRPAHPLRRKTSLIPHR